jgi:hypothetical protein
LQIFALQRITAFLTMAVLAPAAKAQQENGEHGGNAATQKIAENRWPRETSAHGQQRPEKSADGIQRLAQPVGGAANLRRGDVGDQRIRGAPRILCPRGRSCGR